MTGIEALVELTMQIQTIVGGSLVLVAVVGLAILAVSPAGVRFWHRLSCRLGRCRQCRVLSTPEGIGGLCVHCGKVHGWVTRHELQAFAAARDARDYEWRWRTATTTSRSERN